jgi:peptidoglycan/LPS O-acetylase OafA/YrhL
MKTQALPGYRWPARRRRAQRDRVSPNKQWLPGGYVGVDVFFVISGFLITHNIWSGIRDGRFWLADFYLRRIRRIAPASLFVTAATVCAGVFLLQPEDMVRLARSAVWSSLSAANIYFWKYLDTDYFAESSDQQPLLHMWSLGVEEQFYLLWPTLLLLVAMLAGKRKWSVVAFAAAIGIVSFFIAERTNVAVPKFSYFMLPARAGELMVGAVLALAARQSIDADREVRSWHGDAIAIVGIGLLAFSLWKLDDASPFPGINALYPCIGAALLILAGQLRSRLTGVLFACRPMVFVGLISYSLYLWHWPLLAFIRYFYGTVSVPHALIATIATFVLSTATYLWIEQPARRWRGASWKQVAVLLLVPVALVVGGGAVIQRAEGFKAWVEGAAV